MVELSQVLSSVSAASRKISADVRNTVAREQSNRGRAISVMVEAGCVMGSAARTGDRG
jgi:hypothetical protein